MTKENQDDALEIEAADEFARDKELQVVAVETSEKPSVTAKKRLDRATRAKLADGASEAARAFLADPPPAFPASPAVAPPLPVTDASTATRCGCGCILGDAVYGVHDGQRWYCPECYMRGARNHEIHPLARAVECPTCHRKSVDFSGRNQCTVCRSRGARPIRLH